MATEATERGRVQCGVAVMKSVVGRWVDFIDQKPLRLGLVLVVHTAVMIALVIGVAVRF